ncbi:unnamed protein product [Prunus armeniaca]
MQHHVDTTGTQQQLHNPTTSATLQPQYLVVGATLHGNAKTTGAAIHDSIATHDYLNAIWGHAPILEQVHPFPHLPSHLTYAPVGLPAEHELYHELTIALSQTLAEVFTMAECYALWDDNHITMKKVSKQAE